MTVETSGLFGTDGVLREARAAGAQDDWLRRFVIAAGLGCAVLFVLVGVGFRLQLYADGSIFSYAVAIRESWAYHFRDIAARLFVELYAHLPAEAYVALTRDAAGGIALYGLLFFAAPLLGLLATFAADRSAGRRIFTCACLSTAVLCPMVFGFPTEMHIAHALFWPTLALCHYARRGLAGAAAVFAALLALALTHEGAVVFAVAIVATMALRGLRDPAFRRAAGALLAVLAVWAAVKLALPPGAYYARIIPAAEWNFIDLTKLVTMPLFVLLLCTLAGYAAAVLALHRLAPVRAAAYAAVLVALALAVYWLAFDRWLHTQDRYYVRTAILVATPLLGALAALTAVRDEGCLHLPSPLLIRLATALADGAAALTRGAPARAAAGALALVLLVHVVETAKFVAAWTRYEAALRALAIGTASDPALGDARFVSSQRLGADLNRLKWQTTTPFLAVLVAPDFAPARLVVDPTAGYFWLSCALATEDARGARAIAAESRELIRAYECLHR
jgi:hypothetical protein